MKKGDRVLIPSGEFVCIGIHPDGDSMALIEKSLVDLAEIAEPNDLTKADECEFRWDEERSAWVW